MGKSTRTCAAAVDRSFPAGGGVGETKCSNFYRMEITLWKRCRTLWNGKILIDNAVNQRYYTTNKNSMLVGMSSDYVSSEFSNDDLHVYGHGYADAHDFVCSFAAFPEHPGSNASALIICREIYAFEAGSF